MKALKVFRLAVVAAAVAGVGCAEKPQVTIFGNLAYEGDDADVALAVPADADPQVADCLGSSTTQSSDGRGIKTDERITPPYFVALWPAAKDGRPEIHGRLDVPSVGPPLPGDHPFVKSIVCTLGVGQNFDWTMEEGFNGKYYVGAWFDKDMNGYPGKDEPLGFYSGEGTDAVAISFLEEPKQEVDIVIGGTTTSFEEQAETLKANLEQSIDKFDRELFAAQFQPLLFKDPFGRTINQIDEIYEALTDSTNRDATVITWHNDAPPERAGSGAAGRILIAQDKNPAEWDLYQSIEYQYAILLAAGSDGIYQLSDFKPLMEKSGNMEPTQTPPSDFDPNANVEFTVNIPVATDLWFGLEKFVASTTAPSGGTWTTIATPVTFGTQMQGDITFAFGPNNIAMNNGQGDIQDWDATTMMRFTLVPVGADGYEKWADPSMVTEPTRGNYLRFYLYGSQFVYRKQLSR